MTKKGTQYERTKTRRILWFLFFSLREAVKTTKIDMSNIKK